MRAYLSLFLLFVVVIAQSDAFLQEKLSLLKNLKSGLEGGFGGSSGGSYGGGYSGGYNGGYNGGGYNYNPPSRPLYTGGESYGRSSYYNTGNAGGEQVIKVIKVIVPAQQTSSGYAGGSIYSSGAGYSGWAPQPAPVQYRTAPVAYGGAQVQYTAPQPAPVQYRTVQLPPVQAAPVEYGAEQTATVQVQPAPVQVQEQQQQVVSNEPQPAVVTSSFHQPQQTVVKTLKLIVTEEDNGQIGYAPASSSYGSGYGANSASWSQGQNNIGGNLWGKGFQRGGIWQKLGC